MKEEKFEIQWTLSSRTYTGRDILFHNIEGVRLHSVKYIEIGHQCHITQGNGLHRCWITKVLLYMHITIMDCTCRSLCTFLQWFSSSRSSPALDPGTGRWIRLCHPLSQQALIQTWMKDRDLCNRDAKYVICNKNIGTRHGLSFEQNWIPLI